MPDELERLQINIEADASGTVAGAAQAKQAMEGLGQSVKQTTDGIKRGMRDAATSVKGVANAAAKTAKQGNLELIHEAQIAHAEALRSKIKLLNAEVAKAMRKSGGDATSKTVVAAQEKLAKTQLQFAKAAADVDKTAAKIWAADDAAANASAVNETASATEKLKASAGGAAEKVREVRKEIERAGRKGPSIMQSIGRSLRSMLIITAVSRGIMSFVQWMGRAYAADKQVAASLAQVKANLLSAFTPIYNAALPAIQTLVGWLVTLTNAMARFVNSIGRFFGWKMDGIAGSISGVGGAAGGASKELKGLLANFDEINHLRENSSGGGGGGGGGGSGSGGGISTGDIGAMEDSIESINKEGLTASNVLGTLAKGALGYAAALKAVLSVNKIAKGLGFAGIAGKGALKAAGWIGLAIDTGIQMMNVAQSDWYKGEYANLLKIREEYSILSWKRIAAEAKYAAEGAAASVLGVVSGLWGQTGVEAYLSIKKTISGNIAAFKESARTLAGSFKTSFSEALRGGKDLGDMTVMDMLTESIVGPVRKLAEFKGGLLDLFNINTGQMQQKSTDIRGALGTISNAVREFAANKQNWNLGPSLKTMLESSLGLDNASIADLSGGVLKVGNAVKTSLQTVSDTIRESLQQMKDKISQVSKTAQAVKDNTAKTAGTVKENTTVKNAVKNAAKSASETLVKDLTVGGALSVLGSGIKKVLGFASGGIGIPRGQLFIANESGAEMVGHIGGKTAVANQQEISGAIWREMQQYKGGSGANANDIAEAVARALNGTAIKVGERQFGTIAVRAINKYARQSGRADFTF